MKDLLVGATAINKEISLIKAAGSKLDDRIQLAGLSVLDHVAQHGDVTVVNSLFLALPKGARTKALAEWLLCYGKVQKNTDKTAAKLAPFMYSRDKESNLEAAGATPWYKFSPEPKVADMFDFTAALASLMARAEKAEQGGMKIEGADVLTKIRMATV